jgi:hypothetical protein
MSVQQPQQQRKRRSRSAGQVVDGSPASKKQ